MGANFKDVVDGRLTYVLVILGFGTGVLFAAIFLGIATAISIDRSDMAEVSFSLAWFWAFMGLIILGIFAVVVSINRIISINSERGKTSVVEGAFIPPE